MDWKATIKQTLRNTINWVDIHPRNYKHGIIFTSDAFLIALSAWGALAFRFGSPVLASDQLTFVGVATCVCLFSLIFNGAYGSVVRHLGHETIWRG